MNPLLRDNSSGSLVWTRLVARVSLVMLAAMASAFAQTYPSKPVRI